MYGRNRNTVRCAVLLPRISAEDVAFDMDEIIIDEEDYYYTDGTSNSDASSKDSVEDFEL